MACPHCGTRLLHKQHKRLLCCGCGRARLDLDTEAPFRRLRRHGPLLLVGLLCLPLPLGLAILDGVQLSGREVRAGEVDGSEGSAVQPGDQRNGGAKASSSEKPPVDGRSAEHPAEAAISSLPRLQLQLEP